MLKKTKVMTNSKNGFQNRLTVDGSELQSVSHFKYLGSISCEASSKPNILARTAQAAAVMSCLRLVWTDKRIRIGTELKVVQTMVKSIFLYACETWTLTAELQQRIQAAEICWLWTMLGHIICRPCVQQWDLRMSWERGSLQRSAVNSQKMQADVVWACCQVQWNV